MQHAIQLEFVLFSLHW